MKKNRKNISDTGKIRCTFVQQSRGIRSSHLFRKRGNLGIEIPAFTYNTYVMLSGRVISYETMAEDYKPETLKEAAD